MTKEELKENLTMIMDIMDNAPEDKDYALIVSIHENTLESEHVSGCASSMSYKTMCNMIADIIIEHYTPPVNYAMPFEHYLEDMVGMVCQRVKNAREEGRVRRHVDRESFLISLFEQGKIDEGL